MSKRQNFPEHSTAGRGGIQGPAVSGRFLLGAALIAGLALLAYLPCLGGGFILDDDKLVSENPLVRAADGLRRMWFTSEPLDYWPVTNTSFWLEWRLWGKNPTGYHVANLALHIAGALLIWVILRRLSIPGAWLAALLFAVHPVNVESVAWISQRKNTLSLLFFLLSILCYLNVDRGAAGSAEDGSDPPQTNRWYWLSLLSFILAMLSKGSVAILPVVLLGLAWWERRNVTKLDLLRSVPFFVVAAALTVVNIWFQSNDSDMEIRDAGFLERLVGAGAVVWFYLYKALLPLNLVFVYPQWNIEVADWRWWAPLAATLAVSAVLVWQRNNRYGRPLLFAWLFFCLALLPVMGFTDVGFMRHSLVADHYQHIAVIGVVAIVAAAWSRWYERAQGLARSAALAGAILVVGALVTLTWQQCRIYRDPLTLYSTTTAENPDSWLVHNNLGLALADAGRLPEAIDHYHQALAKNPNDHAIYNNLGAALFNSGRNEEAIEQIQQALRLNPDYAEAHNNLGTALVEAGRLQEAIAHFTKSLQLQPDAAEVHNNLGIALRHVGRMQEAIEHFEQALRLEPNYPEAHNNLGNMLKQSGQVTAAIDHYRQALQLKPDYPQAHFNLANMLRQSHRLPEAIDHFQQALQLKPDFADAHNNLGQALVESGRTEEAIQHFEQAVRLKPDSPQAHNNLGNVLLLAGRFEEAIERYQEALRLKPDYPECYANLARAYAQSNRPDEAVAAAQRALELARSSGPTAWIEALQEELRRYRSVQAAGQRASPQPSTPP